MGIHRPSLPSLVLRLRMAPDLGATSGEEGAVSERQTSVWRSSSSDWPSSISFVPFIFVTSSFLHFSPIVTFVVGSIQTSACLLFVSLCTRSSSAPHCKDVDCLIENNCHDAQSDPACFHSRLRNAFPLQSTLPVRLRVTYSHPILPSLQCHRQLLF